MSFQKHRLNHRNNKEGRIMTRKKHGNMTFIIWLVGAIFLITGCLLMPATQAGAEGFKCKITNYVTKVEFIPVGDAKGHIMGVYERRGLVLFEDGEVATLLSRGTFDWTNGNGPGEKYTQMTFKDGSTTWSKSHATATRGPGEKLTSIKFTGEYVKGTGRFKGIKGSISCEGGYVTPLSKETKGDICLECTGTRTLPSN
jgi:hypothetical protein